MREHIEKFSPSDLREWQRNKEPASRALEYCGRKLLTHNVLSAEDLKTITDIRLFRNKLAHEVGNNFMGVETHQVEDFMEKANKIVEKVDRWRVDQSPLPVGQPTEISFKMSPRFYTWFIRHMVVSDLKQMTKPGYLVEPSTFEKALAVMKEFKTVYGRKLDEATLAELIIAQEFDLNMNPKSNEPGYDLVSSSGKRYQVKHRDPNTQNVDLNNFDFDYILLANLEDNYRIAGVWQMGTEKARELFVPREDFRKYQLSQNRFKKNAQRIR